VAVLLFCYGLAVWLQLGWSLAPLQAPCFRGCFIHVGLSHVLCCRTGRAVLNSYRDCCCRSEEVLQCDCRVAAELEAPSVQEGRASATLCVNDEAGVCVCAHA
jgi:hypothetical protein